jgi:hypothetical protein
MKTIAVVLLLILSACSSERGGGRDYLDDLSAMIRASDRIIVTEHSSPLDAVDPDSLAFLLPEGGVVYGTRELSHAQRRMFLATVESLDPTTQDAFAACAPVVHHTVRFYAGRRLMSAMGICFQCGQVLWRETKATPPWALYPGLASVMRQIGFQPERDWKALAMKHLPPREQGEKTESALSQGTL